MYIIGDIKSLASRLLNTLTPPNVFDPVVATEPLNISNASILVSNDADEFKNELLNIATLELFAFILVEKEPESVTRFVIRVSNDDESVTRFVILVEKEPESVTRFAILVSNDADVDIQFST